MIVKGRARSGGEQLAAYLMRTGDGEIATLLDPAYPGEDLHNTFLLFETIGEGTKGEKPLYHPQICPQAKYGRLMTPAQWLRGAEILAEELGMANHPRRTVSHTGGDNPHAHVVFQRTDVDTMTMWDTSHNYAKHVRAAKRMALEFGHELIPAKHDERDREALPEMPRAESTTADHQQAARTDMSFAERKAQITALRRPCDNGLAFKAALEEAGYVLARGDKRGFVVVSAGETPEAFSLSKHVDDIKGKEFKAFMAGVDLATLPDVEEARALQKDRAVKDEKQAVEASKFLPLEGPSGAEKTPEPPPPSQFLPEKQEPAPYDWSLYAPKPPAKQPETAPPAPDQPSKFLPQAAPPAAPEQPSPAFHVPQPAPDWTAQEVTSKFNATQPEPDAPKTPWEDPELRKLRKDIFERQQAEYQKFADANAAAYRARGKLLKDAMRWKMEDFDHAQAEARQALVLRQTRKRKGLRGMLDAVAAKLNPEAVEEKAAVHKEDRSRLRQRQLGERIDYMKRLKLDNAAELQALRAGQLQEQAARESTYNEELARHIGELLEARKIAAALEAEEKLKKENDLAREQSGWAQDFKKEQEYPWEDEPPQKGK